MKICYDNLVTIEYDNRAKIFFTKKYYYCKSRNKMKASKSNYVYCEMCKNCHNPYLTRKARPSNFCSTSCANSGENNPFYGRRHTRKSRQKIIKNHIDCRGPNHSIWKGGVTEMGLAIYDTYAPQISYAEDVRRNPENTDWLQVKCAYCGKWYTTTRVAVSCRISGLNGKLGAGECRFYCSDHCKSACPIYKKSKYPKGFKHVTSREVDPHLRQMVFERDNWTCQKCNKTVEEIELHCHHMDPVVQNPMFQNDMDSCISLCKSCHKEVHSQHGCRYVDLRCSVQMNNIGGTS